MTLRFRNRADKKVAEEELIGSYISDSATLTRVYKRKKVSLLDPERKKVSIKTADGKAIIKVNSGPRSYERPRNRPIQIVYFGDDISKLQSPWTVPEEIQRLRLGYGISIRQMADLIGVTYVTLARMSELTPEGLPVRWLSVDVALRLERLTGVSALDLLSIDASTKIWAMMRENTYRGLLDLIACLPVLRIRRKQEEKNAKPRTIARRKK